MTKERASLRVLSYNIHKGFSASNMSFVLDQIKESIRLVSADLVCLQEVLGHHEKHGSKMKDWPTTSQFEYLADKIWPHYAYGKNAVYTAGHHGNAVLSKYPITFWENEDISTNRLERRGLLHVALEVPGQNAPLHAICLHLGLFENERREQLANLARRIHKLVPDECPLIVAGDFNDWLEKATPILAREMGLHEAFRELQSAHARTFPSWLPVLKLDRIYYRGLRAREALCFTGQPWNELSDHAAVYAELLL